MERIQIDLTAPAQKIQSKIPRLRDLDSPQESLFHTEHEITVFVESEEANLQSSVTGSTEDTRSWLFIGALLLLELGLLWLVCTTWHLSPRARSWLGVFYALNLLGPHVLAHSPAFPQPEVSSRKLSLRDDAFLTFVHFLYLLTMSDTTQGPNSTLNNTRKATQPFRGAAGPSGIMRPVLGASSATAIGQEPSHSENPGSLRRRDLLLPGHSEPKVYAGSDDALHAPGMTKITMQDDMKNKVMCAFPFSILSRQLAAKSF